MKKFLLLIAFFSINMHSQISFGPKLGLLLATTQGSEPEEYETLTKYSFYGGGFVEYKLSKFALDMDINFAIEGSKGKNRYQQNFDDIPLNYDSTLNIYAINFNLTGKYYVLNDLALKGGGYLGNIVLVKYEFDGGPSFKGRQDVSQHFEKTDFGLVFGVEYSVTEQIFFEGKYALGLKNIRKEDPIAGETSIKNRGVFIGFGYKFK